MYLLVTGKLPPEYSPDLGLGLWPGNLPGGNFPSTMFSVYLWLNHLLV